MVVKGRQFFYLWQNDIMARGNYNVGRHRRTTKPQQLKFLSSLFGLLLALILSSCCYETHGFSISFTERTATGLKVQHGSTLYSLSKWELRDAPDTYYRKSTSASSSMARFNLGGAFRKSANTRSALFSSPNSDPDNTQLPTQPPPPPQSPIQILFDLIQSNPSRSIVFSLLMTLCGASLGPFLDSYHSLFGVLSYSTPLVFPLIGNINGETTDLLTCVTTYWVPPLFGIAGFLIGWLYVWLDAFFIVNKAESGGNDSQSQLELHPSVPKVLVGISYFTFQYWLSGILYAHGLDRSSILTIMSVLAAGGFVALDGTVSGFITSAATAIGGPLIEVGLISILPTLGPSGSELAYHYNDLRSETGFFPLWIIPVYFLGGPANGNLARMFWNGLGEGIGESTSAASIMAREDEQLLSSIPRRIPCSVCQGTRAVKCPNCDDGTYVTYGERVVCNACRGKGRVICRTCFSQYGDDPNDIENIRRIMDKIPD